jgi:hypothetical protein
MDSWEESEKTREEKRRDEKRREERRPKKRNSQKQEDPGAGSYTQLTKPTTPSV